MPVNVIDFIDKIVIGTANFNSRYGLTSNYENIDKLLNAIQISGIDRIDMSNRYVFNLKDLREVDWNWRVQYKVQLDLPQPFDSFNQELQLIYAESGSRFIDRILIHNADQIIENHGVDVLEKLVRLIPPSTKFGVSLYEVKNLNTVFNVGFVDVIQFPSNVLDRRLEKEKNSSIFSQKLSNKVLQSRSVFLQGLLLGNVKNFPINLIAYQHILTDWYDWNTSNNLNILESSLSEVLIHQGINEVTIGLDSINHLSELVSSRLEVPRYKLQEEIPQTLIDPRKWQS